MLPARPNALVQFWFDGWCRGALRRHFQHVRRYGPWPPFDPGRSTLYVANHSSFWDGVLLNHLVRRHRRQPAYCMVDERKVRQHPFLRRVGGFSVDRTRPRAALESVDYTAGLLNASPCAVALFPQGRIRPNDERPLAFEGGIARVVEKAPRAQVVVVAFRYEFWHHEGAEAMVSMAPVDVPAGTPRPQILARLRDALTGRLDALKAAGMAFDPGDEVLLEGRRSVDPGGAVE